MLAPTLFSQLLRALDFQMLRSTEDRDTPGLFSMGKAFQITSSEVQLRDLRMFNPEEKEFSRRQSQSACEPQRTSDGMLPGVDFGFP